MQDLVDKRRYPLFMNVVSALTIADGLLLFWNASGELKLVWIMSGPGLAFTVGSVVAIVVYGIGFFMIRPRAERLGALGKAIGVAGGPPTAEEGAELHRLSEEMYKFERLDVILLTISLIPMATARYWNF